MARLQDFQSVTPTSSDKILIVQSQGQGLAPHTIKLDSVNPTGTGSLSLNRKSGTTTGSYSVTTGYNNEATGDYSISQGYGTIANHQNQVAFGQFNVADTSTAASTLRGNYIEIVGKGTSDANRSNARTLDWSGNEVLAGGLKINGSEDVKAIKTTTVSGTTDSTGNIVASDLSPSNKIILSAIKRRKTTESSNLDLAIVSFMPNSGETAYIFHLVNNDGTIYANKSDVKILVAYIDI